MWKVCFLCRVNDGQSFIDSFIDSLIHLSALSSKSYHIIIISYRNHVILRRFLQVSFVVCFLGNEAYIVISTDGIANLYAQKSSCVTCL